MSSFFARGERTSTHCHLVKPFGIRATPLTLIRTSSSPGGLFSAGDVDVPLRARQKTSRLRARTFEMVSGMSIATRTGDKGTTGLMYNRRVSKTHPRVEACGCVDELNAALGLARATAKHDFVCDVIFPVQKELVLLMGEIGTDLADLDRYKKDGFNIIKPEMTARLDELVKNIESQNVSFKDWATPGANINSAALDIARTACRRAERAVCVLRESNQLQNEEIGIYLNRLSDALWLLARWVETKSKTEAK